VIGRGRWKTGQTLMHEANLKAWGRMARLYNACPTETSTELCEAAMAVKTIPPGPPVQPAPGEAKPAPAAPVPVPSPSRGKESTQHSRRQPQSSTGQLTKPAATSRVQTIEEAEFVSAGSKGSSGNIRIGYHAIGLFLDFRCLRSLLPRLDD